jgi:hypothetical protein
MSPNLIYKAIEEELAECLNEGAKLPKTFKICLEPEQYEAFICSGLVGPDKKRIAVDTPHISVEMCGYRIAISPDRDLDDVVN